MTNRRRSPLGTAALLAVLALAGCSQIGDPIEAIGARRPAPDEFKVVPRKPLVVPPTLAQATALPTPDPGRPSPLEPDPAADAVAALTGTTATPRPTATTSISAGESALLSAADAASSNPEIRTQLESDRLAAETADANEPYEPPSLVELFFGKDEEEEALDPAIALDAIAESQRLQREGVAAPNDPLAAAPTEADAAVKEAPRPTYDSLQTGRRPPSPIVGRDTTPAFD